MSWRHLLFMHWPIKVASMRDLIPPDLEIDTFEGEAWLGVIPFTMTIAPRAGAFRPFRRDFHELNVRTYVHDDRGVPGASWACSSRSCSSTS